MAIKLREGILCLGGGIASHTAKNFKYDKRVLNAADFSFVTLDGLKSSYEAFYNNKIENERREEESRERENDRQQREAARRQGKPYRTAPKATKPALAKDAWFDEFVKYMKGHIDVIRSHMQLTGQWAPEWEPLLTTDFIEWFVGPENKAMRSKGNKAAHNAKDGEVADAFRSAASEPERSNKEQSYLLNAAKLVESGHLPTMNYSFNK